MWENISLPSSMKEWDIEEILGEGTYGVVYKARKNINGEDHYCAIKVLEIPFDPDEKDMVLSVCKSKEAASAQFKKQLDELMPEVNAMMKLRGITNIVSFEGADIAQDEDGIGWYLFIRMELLTSLKNYRKEHEMTESDMIKLGIDICSALEYCARANIVHRDIKKENIFISPLGEYKLGDFGIAKNMTASSKTRGPKGTDRYIAPEVYHCKDFDYRADLYSLGMLLYILANNEKGPFSDPSNGLILESEVTESCAKRLSGEPFDAPVNASEAFGKIIMKACAYEPDDRYSSATEMKAALLKLQAGEATEKVAAFSKNKFKKYTALCASVLAGCVCLAAGLPYLHSGNDMAEVGVSGEVVTEITADGEIAVSGQEVEAQNARTQNAGTQIAETEAAGTQVTGTLTSAKKTDGQETGANTLSEKEKKAAESKKASEKKKKRKKVKKSAKVSVSASPESRFHFSSGQAVSSNIINQYFVNGRVGRTDSGTGTPLSISIPAAVQAETEQPQVEQTEQLKVDQTTVKPEKQPETNAEKVKAQSPANKTAETEAPAVVELQVETEVQSEAESQTAAEAQTEEETETAYEAEEEQDTEAAYEEESEWEDSYEVDEDETSDDEEYYEEGESSVYFDTEWTDENRLQAGLTCLESDGEELIFTFEAFNNSGDIYYIYTYDLVISAIDESGHKVILVDNNFKCDSEIKLAQGAIGEFSNVVLSDVDPDALDNYNIEFEGHPGEDAKTPADNMIEDISASQAYSSEEEQYVDCSEEEVYGTGDESMEDEEAEAANDSYEDYAYEDNAYEEVIAGDAFEEETGF